jgi:hypothetical protein
MSRGKYHKVILYPWNNDIGTVRDFIKERTVQCAHVCIWCNILCHGNFFSFGASVFCFVCDCGFALTNYVHSISSRNVTQCKITTLIAMKKTSVEQVSPLDVLA